MNRGAVVVVVVGLSWGASRSAEADDCLEVGTGDVVTTTYTNAGKTITRSYPAPTPSGVRKEIVHLTAWGAPDFAETPDVTPAAIVADWDYDAAGRLISLTDAGGCARDARDPRLLRDQSRQRPGWRLPVHQGS